MTAQLTELVRDSLDHLTDGATVPAGLATRAGDRVRRRAVIRLGAAGAAALTTAALLVTVIAPRSAPRAGAPESTRLTTYVVSHASRALTAAGQSAVSEAWLTPTGAAGIQVISWSGPQTTRTEIIAAGKLVGAGGYVARHDSYDFVTIDYRNRTWSARQLSLQVLRTRAPALHAADMSLPDDYAKQLLQASPGCPGPGPVSAPASISWTGYLHELLACHVLSVAGSGRVDGIAAIRLVTTKADHSTVSAVLWVSSDSYLPLRLALRPLPGASGSSGYQIDLRWLPATAANLARARILPPPAGFRQVGW